MTTPWLSILIPAYNVEPYVAECLHSIFQQIDARAEIIAVDDCSTDGTYAALQQLATISPAPMRLIRHEKNAGVSAARNTLIEAATGRYVWYVDPDDAMLAGAIRQLQHIIAEHAPDLILCDYNVWRMALKFRHRLQKKLGRSTQKKCFVGPARTLCKDPEQLFAGIYRSQKLHLWSKIAKRELWDDKLRFPVDRVLEDVTVTPRLALRANTYYYHPESWIAYRQRTGSILSTFSTKKIEDVSLSCAGILTLWKNRYPSLSENSLFPFRYFCAGLHLSACSELRKSSQHPDLSLYRQRLHDNIQISMNSLYGQMLKRGLWVDVIRMQLKA